MKYRSVLILFALAVASLLAAADTTVGTTNDENCLPFSCGATLNIYAYQEVYSSSAFSSITTFNQLNFGMYSLTPNSTIDGATYYVLFSYTSAPVNGLNTLDPTANIGLDEQSFGYFTLGPTVSGDALVLSGNTFTYDPTLGNLLMTVYVQNVTSDSAFNTFFNADYSGNDFSSAVFTYANSGPYEWSLVTTFSDVSSPVPEPASVMLMGSGLIGVAGLVRRKLKA